jgi:(1->4)-alpha-D-glucan 1-alpha-D-glucosylmutase
VPDIYHGMEVWDLSLVDPDNRRPVDYEARKKLLEAAATLQADAAWAEWESGMPKLWLIRRVLNLRARRSELFAASAKYEGLSARGAKSAHAVIFKRGENLIAIVPRLVLGLNGDWQDTTLDLPEGNWRNELTGESVPRKTAPLSGLLRQFPVALLVREEKL